ncbi:MAG TPA: permease-like cell division protein FtsX [Gammaproteobacteria bacterium]|nr:permease-like cell division protein FtsX [Gammaproteobacteria bacterium]
MSALLRALGRYVDLHLQNFVDALRRLAGQPFATLMTLLVIAIALALPAGLRVTLSNLGAVSSAWQVAADFTAYLKLEVGADRARALAREIDARDDVAQVRLVDRAAALAEFRERSGLGEALAELDGNPLPDALVIRPTSGIDADVAAVAAAIRSLPEVDLVQVDTAWVARLRAILALAGRVVNLATVLLAVAVAMVVGNTIRLEINQRRVEIEVTKLVGGTDGFIRRPFLYLGLCYGLGGAVLAAALIAVTLALLAAPVRTLAGLYGSDFELAGLSLRELAILIGGGALLGWAGAGLATARHLRAIEPT